MRAASGPHCSPLGRHGPAVRLEDAPNHSQAPSQRSWQDRRVPHENTDLAVRAATSADRPAVIETISLAFHNDPTWSWAFPDPSHRQEQYAAFWGLMIAGALRYPWVLSRADRGRQISLATVVPGPPLRLCEELGVAVGLGCDGIRDLWSPFASPISSSARCCLRGAPDSDVTTTSGSRSRRRSVGARASWASIATGSRPDCVADLVLVPAESPGDALMRRAPRSLVLKRGRIVGGQR